MMGRSGLPVQVTLSPEGATVHGPAAACAEMSASKLAPKRGRREERISRGKVTKFCMSINHQNPADNPANTAELYVGNGVGQDRNFLTITRNVESARSAKRSSDKGHFICDLTPRNRIV